MQSVACLFHIHQRDASLFGQPVGLCRRRGAACDRCRCIGHCRHLSGRHWCCRSCRRCCCACCRQCCRWGALFSQFASLSLCALHNTTCATLVSSHTMTLPDAHATLQSTQHRSHWPWLSVQQHAGILCVCVLAQRNPIPIQHLPHQSELKAMACRLFRPLRIAPDRQ
jgi:hypothetical protein